ncbi:MAG: hypothetical protein WA749_05115 [Gelidibacter sp.]
MPSGITAKVLANNTIDSIKIGQESLKHRGSMGNMGAACIALAGYDMASGTGVSHHICRKNIKCSVEKQKS